MRARAGASARAVGLQQRLAHGARPRHSGEYHSAGPTYRADIVAFMRTYLNDPTGVRDAFISEPALRTLESADRYTVCLRYTARNACQQG